MKCFRETADSWTSADPKACMHWILQKTSNNEKKIPQHDGLALLAAQYGTDSLRLSPDPDWHALCMYQKHTCTICSGLLYLQCATITSTKTHCISHLYKVKYVYSRIIAEISFMHQNKFHLTPLYSTVFHCFVNLQKTEAGYQTSEQMQPVTPVQSGAKQNHLSLTCSYVIIPSSISHDGQNTFVTILDLQTFASTWWSALLCLQFTELVILV